MIRQYTENEELHQEPYAMKMMHKPTLKRERWAVYNKDGSFDMSNALEKVYSEIEIWSQVHHQNIVKLFELIEADGHDYLYLIIEFWDLGQLSKWDFTNETYVRNPKIVEFYLNTFYKDKEFESEHGKIEAVAKLIFKDVLTALEYLHASWVAHRDIKPDNILICSRDAKAKLSDFSVSWQLPNQEGRMYNCEGTVAFTAPESHVPDESGFLVLPTDIWSVGVTLFTYLSERVPFYAESELEMQIHSQKKEVEKLEGYSDDWNDIIAKMLMKDPSERPSVHDLLDHPWFNEEQQ